MLADPGCSKGRLSFAACSMIQLILCEAFTTSFDSDLLIAACLQLAVCISTVRPQQRAFLRAFLTPDSRLLRLFRPWTMDHGSSLFKIQESRV